MVRRRRRRDDTFSTRNRVKWLLSPLRRARAYWLASLRLGPHTEAATRVPPHVWVRIDATYERGSVHAHAHTVPRRRPPDRKPAACVCPLPLRVWLFARDTRVWNARIRVSRALAPANLARARVHARRTAEREGTSSRSNSRGRVEN